MSPALGRVGHLIVPVADVVAAVAFYTETLGFELRFRDGDRYASVREGGVTIGLAGPLEWPAERGTTLSLEVDDLEAARERLEAGGITTGAVERGGHEDRLTITDPTGHTLLVYAGRPPA